MKCLLACLAALFLGTPAFAADRPNVVLIFCDDMGYADPSCFGGKTPTPNLERLAKEGVRFTDFYVSTAVCSASRSALLTGCFHRRVGIEGALGPNAKIGISDKELLIPQMLKQQGYATGMIGKWHLGSLPQFMPLRHGFDSFYGLPYSHDMWPKHPANPKAYPDLPLYDGDKVVKLNPEPGELTIAYTQHAVHFIEKAEKDKPFFLYLAHNLPHVPLGVSEKFAGKSGRGLYGDVMLEIDDSVGQVLDVIKRTGRDENTLVIFTSDNGPWLLYGDHAGSALPLREGKATSFDGGVRTPCLMRWPGKIPAGTVSHEMIWSMDVLPTLAKLSGAELSKDRVIDGKDIWPLMSNQPGAKSPHEFYPVYWGGSLQAIRSGKWKLHLGHDYSHPDPVGGGGKPGQYKTLKIGVELFDLEADISESKDVAAANPEVVKKLQAYADQVREDLGDAKLKIKGKGVREPGRAATADASSNPEGAKLPNAD
jgi:arylsulfatase A-like enzyme